MTTSVVTHSAAETIALGESLATTLKAPALIALFGELGSGKTCFVKGLARGLGSDDLVTSPTFTLVHHYLGAAGKVRHFDLYRITSPRELEDLEIFTGDRESFVLIEWPEIIQNDLPANSIKVRFEAVPDQPDERKITIEYDQPLPT
jgi:tRNA threonylcarbamoyladenosine biosynthesis protein TsaE